MYNSSRNTIANKQQNRNYRPSGAIAQHVIRETQEIDSTEKVVEINGSFWVLSETFAAFHRYYRVVVEQDSLAHEKWYCSASNEKVARQCKAAVQAYISTQIKAVEQSHYEALVASGDPFLVA